jgi:ferrous iron transport protein A
MSPIKAQTLQFSALKKGMRARIVRIVDCPCELERLQEMGLTEGTEFRVVKVAPFGDPVEIDVRGYRLCLRKKETSCFEVERVQE